MSKRLSFKQVKEALINATRETNNFLKLCRGQRDARDNKSIKFHTVNVCTNNTQVPFRTLKQVVSYYELSL